MKRRFTLIITAIMLMMTSFAWGQTRTQINWTASEQGYTNQQAITSVVFDANVSATFDKGTNNNAPKYYTNGTAIRCYGGNYFTISTTSGNLTEIAITFGASDGSNAITTDVGTYENGTWTGSATSVTFTIGGTTGNRRIAGFSITYSTGGQQTVATPTFSPAAGTYTEAQNVTISCTTDGATIHYTLDGTDPTTSSNTYSTPIAISTTTTVKAMAVKAGMSNSSVATATYTFPTTLTIAEARALAVNAYALVQGVVTFIDGRNVYVQDETAGIDLFLNTNTVPSSLALGDMVLAYGKRANYNGLIELSNIDGSDTTQFKTISTGNTLPLAEKTIADILTDHNGDKMLQSTRVNIIDATIGTINTGGNTTITQGESTLNIYKIPALEGIVAGDAIDVIGVVGCYNNPQLRVAYATDVVLHQTQMDTVATPTFTPIAGEYTEAQNVEIACETEGATIYYTLDGTEPTANSAIYSAAIAISETTTVKAIALKDGMIDSEVATAEYTINIAPPTTLTFTRLSSHTDVTDNGIYMIVDVAGGYALTSANGTGSAPAAVAVTIVGDSITGEIDEALQWNFTAVDGGYKISPVSDSLVYLYTTNTNNGVRVGSNTNNVWELDITDDNKPTYHGFKNVAFSRYIGVYNNADWRTYTSIHNNIVDTQIEIFVLGATPVPPTMYNVSVADGITNGIVEVSPTSAEENDTITVTATPSENYELATLTYTDGQTTYDIDQTTMKFVMPAADVTVNATFSEIPAPPTTLTFNKLFNHTDVTDNGIYMIVDVAGGYALTSANGTGSAPAAVAVTIVGDSITGEIDEALQWNFTAVDGGYKISPVNDSLDYLYTTNTNNGVRVGSNTNNVWELDITDANKPTYHGFKNVAFSRYIGVYNNADWRTYTSIHNNIVGTQIEIFVLGDAPTPTYYNVTVADSIANGTVTVDPTTALENDTITVTATPDDTYELATLTYTDGQTTYDIDQTTMKFVMPAADVTVNATFSQMASVEAPTFTPAAGLYISAQTVTLECATEGATIYYTIDGTEPTTDSPVYTEPFIVSMTTTVKAFAVKEGMLNSTIATAEYTMIEVMTIESARALAVNEYALVQGIVTFIDNRNIYVQDATAGIVLYLNSNTVPDTLAIGDMVKGYGKVSVYNGLVELTGINGGNENQFIIISEGNELPLAVKTIAEILEDHAGAKMLQSTRVQIVDAVCGTINNNNNTPISQGENTLNIYKLPVVTGLEQGDIMTVTGVIGCYNNPQLRVASATDVVYAHPAGITVNPAALSGFTYVYEEGPSTVKTFNISGRSLTATTYIHSTTNYEISSFPGETFYPENTITINTYTGTYNYTIKVRLKAGLEVGAYNDTIVINQADVDDIFIPLSGNVTGDQPQPQGDYVRISDLAQLTNGAKVIFAARFDENATSYYAMTAQASGKPEGVLFTSVEGESETLPSEILDAEDTFYWTVEVDGANYTFTNANGEVLGYTSSTNFATGGANTAWAITYQTSEATAMVPEYSAFVINNVNNAVRAFALNSNHNFGPYHTQNIAAENYNFFIDMFATAGGGTMTCATPTFTPEAGTYFETQEVTIACTTADATIYYTTDGTEPDENSAVYSEPIAVEESMTIKAIAMKEGYENSNVATAEYTIILGAVTIFQQDWEGDMNGWTFVTVEGNKPWTIAQYSGNHYAYGNGYNGGVNEQWCISPAFSLNVYSNASLNFRNAKNYTGPDMQLFFSNDYDGENPSAATWVELEYVKSTGSYAWTESGSIDLANFTGDECYIGFKYTSTETEAAAWEVDDVTLMGFTSDPYLTVTPSALTGFTYIVGNGPSQAQTFTVSGGNLPPAPGGTSGGVNITCDNTHYEFSLDGEEYLPSITIEVVGTLEPTMVYVRLEEGLFVGQWDGVVTLEDGGVTATVTVSGNVTEQPVPGDDWNRILSLSDLHDGDQVIIASRYDATVGDGYYAMPAEVSGKPEGVLFTSVNDGGVEKLPAEISSDADTYLWNVTLDGDIIMLVNAAGDTLGYSSSTNFAGGVNPEWNIVIETSGENAMIPNYTGFVITNGTTTNRGIAKNASNKFGAYSTSNLNNADYNFYMDLFVNGGTVTPTVATPVFSMASGTYFETIEVEITCATEGATIYYTTDGSDPTAESEIYEEPIVVESDMTIKAIAMMEDYEDSGIATATYVIMSDVHVILSQDWEGEMNGWTFVTIEGNKPWVIGQYNNNHYANANGYGDDVDNEQWCISPAFDLSSRDERNVTLTFMNATKFDGPALELYISEDYDGQDPTAATWEPLDYIASEGNYVWTESGEISLNAYTGESCHIGFRYISTIDEGAAAWEVDDILIVAENDDNVITPEATFSVNVWNHYNELTIENNSDRVLDMMVYNIVGQPVMSKTVATGSNIIRHDLAEGVYIVRIGDSKEMTGVKVVVRH